MSAYLYAFHERCLSSEVALEATSLLSVCFTPENMVTPNGTLLCPAHHSLYPQERRPERDGSFRVLYAARIGACRTCARHSECQESKDTAKPRRVSAVFWPTTTMPAISSTPVAALPQAPPTVPEPIPRFPVLMQDWPRCQIRRQWLKVVRSETVVVAMGTPWQPDR